MGQEVQEKGGLHDRGRVVRRYLSALDARKPGRTTARTAETVAHRMHQIDTLLLSADPVQRLHLTQERIDLHSEWTRLRAANGGDFDSLEKAFIRVAKSYGDRHDVTYSAWRQVGVDAEVLAQAGINPQAKPVRKVEAATSGATTEAPKPDVATPQAAKPKSKPPQAQASTPKKPKPPAKKSEPNTKAPAAKKATGPKKAPGASKQAGPEQQQLPAEAHLLS